MNPILGALNHLLRQAAWARQQLETWGLQNAHLEPFPFGRGWSFEKCTAQVIHPGLPRTRDKDAEKWIKRAQPFN